MIQMHRFGNMDAKKASKILQKTIQNPKIEFSIADASVQSGLSFYAAKIGLLSAVVDFRGEIIPTEKGDLLFKFPNGFSNPLRYLKIQSVLLNKTRDIFIGVIKFLARTWITAIIVIYTVIFLAIIIAISLAHKSDKDHKTRSFDVFDIISVFIKIIADSFFWNFHPFSPLKIKRHQCGNEREKSFREKTDNVSFYEKVNKFFFGPEKLPKDPFENKKIILKVIRNKNGRIGSFDILKATGLHRKDIDPIITNLLLEYNGDIIVSNHGTIIYSFPELRKTTAKIDQNSNKNNIPHWVMPKNIEPLTGNDINSNLLIAGINGLNFFMSAVAIENHWNLNKLKLIISGIPGDLISQFNTEGHALILGWIPFSFSLFLFLIPIIRYLVIQPLRYAKIKYQNGKNRMIWIILTNLKTDGIDEAFLINEWKKASNLTPNIKDMLHEIIQLNGELNIDTKTGKRKYLFKSLELEIEALKTERQLVDEEERNTGSRIEF